MRHRILSFLALGFRTAFSAAVRTVVTGFVVGVCALIVMRYMGVPIPSANEVLHNIESITGLARLLS